jgi:hypothetical protein
MHHRFRQKDLDLGRRKRERGPNQFDESVPASCLNSRQCARNRRRGTLYKLKRLSFLEGKGGLFRQKSSHAWSWRLLRSPRQGASKETPGHEPKKPGDAKKYAPGQEQKKPGDAKKYAPGHETKK